ncbi:MAG: DinB family protein [Labilibaculum antarcticum]
MKVLSVSKIIINQLIALCRELSSQQYSAPLDLLMNNSIGKHVRHIVEFYDLLKDSCKGDGVLSYDKREHCKRTETEIKVAVDRFKDILKWLDEIDSDVALKLKVSYEKTPEEGFEIHTSLERELVYNIEHAIHHMAIIRIAIEREFLDIKLDKHFGLAFSTIRFRDDLCAH